MQREDNKSFRSHAHLRELNGTEWNCKLDYKFKQLENQLFRLWNWEYFLLLDSILVHFNRTHFLGLSQWRGGRDVRCRNWEIDSWKLKPVQGQFSTRDNISIFANIILVSTPIFWNFKSVLATLRWILQSLGLCDPEARNTEFMMSIWNVEWIS